VLGRETALQEAYWGEDDWLYVKNGPVPSLDVEVPGTRDEEAYWKEICYKFQDGLHKDFQWLRTPEPERLFAFEEGKLVLTGRESIGSWYEQSLVARRQTHFSFDAETVVDFSPEDERQFAGLTLYYSRYNFFYLAVSAHSDGQREIQIMRSEDSWPNGKLTDKGENAYFVSLPAEGKVKLVATIRGSELQFYYALVSGDGKQQGELQKIGPVLDASIVSDECGGHQASGSFTGSFIGLACSDLNGTEKKATFDYLVYRPAHDATDRYRV
jgi:xylan 1,4-beta-xylosidase